MKNIEGVMEYYNGKDSDFNCIKSPQNRGQALGINRFIIKVISEGQ